MKFLYGLLGVALGLALFVGGAWVAWAGLAKPEAWAEAVKTAADMNAKGVLRLPVGLGGLLAAGLTLLWALSAALKGRNAKFLSFDNPGGDVRVSLDAIRDFLSGLARDVPAVTSLKPRISTSGASLCIDLDVRVKAGSALPDLSARLQDLARRSMVQKLGLSDIKKVRVSVREIVGEAAPSLDHEASDAVFDLRHEEDSSSSEVPDVRNSK